MEKTSRWVALSFLSVVSNNIPESQQSGKIDTLCRITAVFIDERMIRDRVVEQPGTGPYGENISMVRNPA
jgi:hypothetical protein